MIQKLVYRISLCLLVALMLVAIAPAAAASSDFVQQSGKVFTVYPSGGDDTANIQKAFGKAVAAGPGSTVKLAAGNFRTRFVEVWNFDGTFKGAGQNATVIDTFADQDCQAQVDNNRWPALIRFYSGNVRISDLGFHITPAMPCKPYLFGDFGADYMASWIDTLLIQPSPFIPETDCSAVKKEMVSGSVTRVAFRGEQGVPQNGETDPVYSNIGESIVLGGVYATADLSSTDCTYYLKYAQGSFSITDTTHQNILIGIGTGPIYNSSLVVRRNSYDGGTNGIILEEASGSKIEASYNHIQNGRWSGIWVWTGDAGNQPYITAPSTYDIHHNDIQAVETSGWWTSGIIVWDNHNLAFPSAGKTAVVNIHENRITQVPLDSADGHQSWGIWMEGVDDSLIAGNSIASTRTVTVPSSTAIYTGSWGPSKRVMILGNNLKGFKPNPSNPYTIVLEAGTTHYVVVGEPPENVANYGTDNLIANLHFQTQRTAAPDGQSRSHLPKGFYQRGQR